MNFFSDIRDGINDVKNMLMEGNYKPFLNPLICVVAVAILVSFLNKSAVRKVSDEKKKIEALVAESDNIAEYKASKELYENLVPKLPPLEKKDEWLLTQIISLYNKIGAEMSKTGRNELETEGDITLSSVNVEALMDYTQLGKLVEAIENYPQFLRISEISITRPEGDLGKIRVLMRINTIFVPAKSLSSSEGEKGTADKGKGGTKGA